MRVPCDLKAPKNKAVNNITVGLLRIGGVRRKGDCQKSSKSL
jgi:hypothetical protein